MKRFIFLIFIKAAFLLFPFGLLHAQLLNYPKIKIRSTEHTYFGTTLTDEFSVLENVKDDEVLQWIKAQDGIARDHLKTTQKKNKSYFVLNKLGYAEFRLPQKVGGLYYSFAFVRDDRNAALISRKKVDSQGRIEINPRDISWNDNIELHDFAISKNNKLMAFTYGVNGSDWREIRVKKVNSDQYLSDKITEAKFTSPVWRGEGFFYEKFNKHGQFSAESGQQLLYHKIGTEESEDELVFKSKPGHGFGFQVTDDERFLIIYEVEGDKDETTVYFIDYEAENPSIRPLISKTKAEFSIVGNEGGLFFAHAQMPGQEGVVVQFTLDQPTKWEAMLPPIEDAVLYSVKMLNGMFMCRYFQKNAELIAFFTKDGELVRALPFPAGYHVGGFMGGNSSEETVYFLTSYFMPPVAYTLDLNTFEAEIIEKTKVNFDPTDFEIKTIEYPSKDGVLVPMTLFYKKGMKQNGKRPVLLKTYGGYGTVHTPRFDESLVMLAQKGGIFAYAHVRGEGNMGEDWAKAGRFPNKQNCINDFIAAAEYLIGNNYTNPEKLAITGASHGGFIVGAAMVQRPELFKVAVPIVAALDMIKFENYTIGSFSLNREEFGTTDSELGFEQLFSYSPYHNIKPGGNYPTTLLMTSENDDRVPPFHSYKFAAKLQNNEGQTNPVFLRVEKKAGHYGAQDLRGSLEEMSDMISFVLYHLDE